MSGVNSYKAGGDISLRDGGPPVMSDGRITGFERGIDRFISVDDDLNTVLAFTPPMNG